MTPKTDNSRLPIGHQPEVPKRQILLIDDDQDMAEMLAEYLNPEGYFVHLAHAAEAGLERAKEGGLVLIILDVMLPDRNGFVVLNEIRQKSRIPVIMLTTRSSVADKVSGLESGADDYVAKPFTPVELLASSARTVWRRESPPRFSIRMAEVLSVRNKWVLIRQGRSSLEALCWDVPVTEQMRGDFLVEFYGRTRICVVSLLDETAILRKSRAATTS